MFYFKFSNLKFICESCSLVDFRNPNVDHFKIYNQLLKMLAVLIVLSVLALHTVLEVICESCAGSSLFCHL